MILNVMLITAILIENDYHIGEFSNHV